MTTELPTQASYVKPIDVEQLPAQPASTFKAIEGYSRETNAEREAEAEEMPSPDASATEAPDQELTDAEILADDERLTNG